MKYLLWSWRHHQWWGWDGSGYTPKIERAGQYTWASAAHHMESAMPGAITPVSMTLANQVTSLDPEEVEATLTHWRTL